MAARSLLLSLLALPAVAGNLALPEPLASWSEAAKAQQRGAHAKKEKGQNQRGQERRPSPCRGGNPKERRVRPEQGVQRTLTMSLSAPPECPSSTGRPADFPCCPYRALTGYLPESVVADILRTTGTTRAWREGSSAGTASTLRDRFRAAGGREEVAGGRQPIAGTAPAAEEGSLRAGRPARRSPCR